MEEQKKAKSVNMGKSEEDAPKKYTYDELNNICNQQFQQMREMAGRIQQLEYAINEKRLDCLFKVIELSSKASVFHFSDKFVSSCVAEIEEALTPIEEESSKEN